MLTFSVNPKLIDDDKYKYMSKIIKAYDSCHGGLLLWSMELCLSESFIQIMESDNPHYINLYKSAQYRRKEALLNRVSDKSKHEISLRPVEDGLVDTNILETQYNEEDFNSVDMNSDEQYYTEHFKYYRTRIFRRKGKDIYKLLKLALNNNSSATLELYNLIEEDKIEIEKEKANKSSLGDLIEYILDVGINWKNIEGL